MRPGAVFIVALLTSVLVGEPPEARSGASVVRFPADVPPRNDIALDNRVPIPLRDGVRLLADVYRPAGDGRYPVLVSKTPYSTERFPTAYEAAVYFAQRGYVYVYADVRGRHESEGEWQPFFNSAKDGYDLVEWAAKQRWSDGKVAMQGGSYLEQNQWRAAQAAPPSLVTIFPMVSSTSIYHEWLAHPDYDNYWKPLSVEEQFDRIAIPVHTLGGWFDIFSQGTLRGYVGMSQKGASENARRSHLVMGPWGHGPSQKTGALDFGPDANIDANALQLRWYDYWLKGIDNGLTAEAPVKLFVMGRNEWVFEREYPLARTEYRPFYFTSGGTANSNRGDGGLTWEKPGGASPPDRFRYDPDDPVPTTGGNNCCGTPTAAGPQDQRPIEARRDVLIYDSVPLQEELEATGPVKVVLYASSDAVDTDFVAKLVDVYPDGSSYNMAEGIMRARYRDSLSKPSLMKPGEVYRFE